MRLLAGVLAGQRFDSTLTGDASLQRRPMRRVMEPLGRMGARIEAREGNFAPLEIRGAALQAIAYTLPVASAQVKSAILLAGLFADGETKIEEPVRTRDHTEIALREFGARVSRSGNTISICGRPALEARRLDRSRGPFVGGVFSGGGAGAAGFGGAGARRGVKSHARGGAGRAGGMGRAAERGCRAQ